MVMNQDIFIDTLFDGSDERLRELAAEAPAGSGYSYEPEYGSFWVDYGNTKTHMHKCFYEPNCVAVFGETHRF